MGALLESGMVGNIGLKHLKVIKEDTLNKWDKLGFLSGLNGHSKENIAQLYENQATHLINEATTSDSSGSFETVVFPIIRRVFSKLLANDIVSVQAMNLPIGKLFYFVPKVSSRRDTGASLTEDGRHWSAYGADSSLEATLGQTPSSPTSATTINLYDNYYVTNDPLTPEDGLYDISKGRRSGTTAVNLFVQKWNASARTLSQATTADSELTSLTSATSCLKTTIVRLIGFDTQGTGKLIGPNGNEMDSEEFLASLTMWTTGSTTCKSGSTYYNTSTAVARKTGAGTVTPVPVLFRVVTQKYGQGIVSGLTSTSTNTRGGSYESLCDANGDIYIELDLSCPACIKCDSVDGYVCSYYAGGSFTTTAAAQTYTPFMASWYSYYDLEFEDEMGEVSFDLESVTVSVTEKKIKSSMVSRTCTRRICIP